MAVVTSANHQINQNFGSLVLVDSRNSGAKHC